MLFKNTFSAKFLKIFVGGRGCSSLSPPWIRHWMYWLATPTNLSRPKETHNLSNFSAQLGLSKYMVFRINIAAPFYSPCRVRYVHSTTYSIKMSFVFFLVLKFLNNIIFCYTVTICSLSVKLHKTHWQTRFSINTS